ncbi:hypothetical protein AB8880_03445 [Alphaproteobacteria bacterium LSUCC0684]
MKKPLLAALGALMLAGLGNLPLLAPPLLAHEKNKTPCMVDVVFQDDANGVATYFMLRLQLKNRSGRGVEAVSVLVRDESGALVRNSDAICGEPGKGIGAGDTGQCEKAIQVITGKMSQKVGYDVWVKMIDDQRTQLQNAHMCEILGVRYLKG